MKIITYSDLHFEFGSGWQLPQNIDGDIMILAGDIVSFRNYNPLTRLLKDWNKPVLYVAGNHEYYTNRPMEREQAAFRLWLHRHHPNVTFLLDEAISIDGVHFFGGTMWTDFRGENPLAMETARYQMNDFRLIRNEDGDAIMPSGMVQLHKLFVSKLRDWFEKGQAGPHVVISHHAPVLKEDSRHKSSSLTPAFNSLDMVAVIEQYQPDLWIYGHTHECDEQIMGKTKIISNQSGYPKWPAGGFECPDFDKHGKLQTITAEL